MARFGGIVGRWAASLPARTARQGASENVKTMKMFSKS